MSLIRLDELKTQWDNFVSILNSSDILLKNTKDKLVWSWNRSTGAITANLTYQSNLFLNNMEERKWWYKAIWDLNIPIKLTCFMSLCLKECILTGVNYKKRGAIGPSVCNMCLRNDETTTYFFVGCSKTQKIWSEVLKFLKIDSEWKCSSIEENLKLWFIQFPKLRHIPSWSFGAFGNLKTKYYLRTGIEWIL